MPMIQSAMRENKFAYASGYFNNCSLNCVTHFLVKRLLSDQEEFLNVFNGDENYRMLLEEFKNYYGVDSNVALTWAHLRQLFENYSHPQDREFIFSPVLRQYLRKLLPDANLMLYFDEEQIPFDLEDVPDGEMFDFSALSVLTHMLNIRLEAYVQDDEADCNPVGGDVPIQPQDEDAQLGRLRILRRRPHFVYEVEEEEERVVHDNFFDDGENVFSNVIRGEATLEAVQPEIKTYLEDHVLGSIEFLSSDEVSQVEEGALNRNSRLADWVGAYKEKLPYGLLFFKANDLLDRLCEEGKIKEALSYFDRLEKVVNHQDESDYKVAKREIKESLKK